MITRDALLWLSQREGLKDFATRFGFFKKLTTRFVAGDTIDEVVPLIRQLNTENCTASFDHLNESVGSAAEAEQEVTEYLNILSKIDESQIDSNVSIKLTQFGLGLDKELAYRNGGRFVEDALRRGNFVRFDM
jgi:proline dehydrogenase